MASDIQLIQYYIDLVIRRFLVWVVPAVVVFAVGAAYVMTMPRTYFAEAVIVVRSQQMPSALVQSTVATERLQFIEQRALKRENLLRLVETFDLFPELSTQLSNTELAQLMRQQITINMRASEGQDQASLNSVFGIGVTAREPDLAAAVASEIVAMIVEENRAARMMRANEATDFLEREVKLLNDRVREIDARLIEFVGANENSLPSRLSLHLGEIRDGQSELAELELAASEARTNAQLYKAELAMLAAQASDPLDEQQVQLNALRASLTERGSVLSPAHPEIRSLNSRIEALEAQIASTGSQTDPAPTVQTARQSREMSLLMERIDVAERREAALATQRESIVERMEALRQTVSLMPNIEAELTLLERERDGAQADLENMSGRLNLARLSQRLETDQQGDQIQLLEVPEAPTEASGAPRWQYLVALLAASLMVGLGCLLVADMTDKTIRGNFDIAPVLGHTPTISIPNWSTQSQHRAQVATAIAAVLLLALAASVTIGQLGLYETQILSGLRGDI